MPGVGTYESPAGDWDALKAVAKSTCTQMDDMEAIERFANPQSETEMARLGSRRVASTYLLVRSGDEAAILKCIMKALLVVDDEGIKGVMLTFMVPSTGTPLKAVSPATYRYL